MSSPTIQVQGLAEALRGLDPASMLRLEAGIVELVAHDARIRLATYPPETEANAPGPYPKRWYQRGFGPRWRNADGSLGGRNTSERLQYSWRQMVTHPLSQSVEPIAGALGRPVSYAPYVQDAEEQTDVHRRHGWKTNEQVAQDVANDATLNQQIDSLLDTFLR